MYQKVLAIKPQSFCSNPQTASDNVFQNLAPSSSNSLLQAQNEHNAFMEKLQANGIETFVFDEERAAQTPDALFPNNWVLFWPDGRVFLFPMMAPNRRRERRIDVIERTLAQIPDAPSPHIVDLSFFEEKNQFLEGTGAMIIDHGSRSILCALSERASLPALQHFCELVGYQHISFQTQDPIHKKPIYHSNVLMSLGQDYVLIGMDLIPNKQEQKRLMDFFSQSRRKVLELSFEQICAFSGNALELKNLNGQRFLALSSRAHKALTPQQTAELEKRSVKIISSPIQTIEDLGGGSARCLLAALPEFCSA